MSADQAADLLGVRLQTIYAYVSRGLLTRTHHTNAGGHRTSGFDRTEVLRLVAERTRVRTGSLEVLVETDITLLDPKGALSFRGHDAVALSVRPFEEVAAIVWGVSSAPDDAAGWVLDTDRATLVRRVVAVLPDTSADVDRVRATVLALAGADEHRADVDLDHVTRVGRRAVAAGIVAVGEGASCTGPVAGRVLRALRARTPQGAAPTISGEPDPTLVEQAVNAALVLLLDHELAASTMAVRIAAGTGADPWLVLLTGLAALGGPRHGRSSVLVEQLLDEIGSRGVGPTLDRYASGAPGGTGPAGGSDGSGPAGSGGERLRGTGPVPPGFGHKVYLDADPRAEALLDHVARLDPQGWPLLEELLVAVSERCGLSPNVDLALAALVRAGRLRSGSGEALFALSRMVGWLAHASEEYPQGLRFRPRAIYTGDGPDASAGRS